MNDKLNNRLQNTVGYEDAGGPPAQVPIQQPVRDLPPPPKMDEKCRDILNETSSRSLQTAEVLDSNWNWTLGSLEDKTQTYVNNKPFILNANVISAINGTITRN